MQDKTYNLLERVLEAKVLAKEDRLLILPRLQHLGRLGLFLLLTVSTCLLMQKEKHVSILGRRNPKTREQED